MENRTDKCFPDRTSSVRFLFLLPQWRELRRWKTTHSGIFNLQPMASEIKNRFRSTDNIPSSARYSPSGYRVLGFDNTIVVGWSRGPRDAQSSFLDIRLKMTNLYPKVRSRKIHIMCTCRIRKRNIQLPLRHTSTHWENLISSKAHKSVKTFFF